VNLVVRIDVEEVVHRAIGVGELRQLLHAIHHIAGSNSRDRGPTRRSIAEIASVVD